MSPGGDDDGDDGVGGEDDGDDGVGGDDGGDDGVDDDDDGQVGKLVGYFTWIVSGSRLFDGE